nr:immunoglobulin light chain junction region [Macaca mulatta]MOV98906.1 immunoglobulin light chain junction region [Macaca mulatta]
DYYCDSFRSGTTYIF